MNHTIATQSDATRRETLAAIRPQPAKAELRGQAGATALRTVAADALRRVTSQKAAAADLELSEGRLSHKLQDGSLTLKQLEVLGPAFAAEFGQQLSAAYREVVKSSKERARERLPELIREILEATA